MWKRVFAPTALVSLLWVLASCGTSYVLARLDASQTRVLYSNRNVIQAAGGMQEHLWRLQTVMLGAAEQIDVASLIGHDFRAEAAEAEASFDQEFVRADENASTSDEHALVRAIHEQFAQYRSYLHERLLHEDLSAEVSADAIEREMRLARAVAQPCEQLSQLAVRLTDEAFRRRDRLRARVDVARFAFIIIGPAVGIFLGLRVARRLHLSISQISVTLRDASGNLEQEVGLVEVRPTDDLDSLPALQRQVQDVSVRIKQVVDELHRTRREAVRAERLAAVGELAAGVAHEVRNPLTSVKLLIQTVARHQSAGSSDEERLRIVQEEVARIETIIQELLDYARPPQLRRVRHDVRDTLRRALNLIEGRAQQRRVVVHEELGAAPLPVDGDPEQLDQVFINLLLNAIEAMSTGGKLDVVVEPCAATSTAPSGLLRIVFHDSGSGIPAEIIERLFEPFVTSKERGIGLGLAISRRIMQQHGGRLTACNAESGGALFVVELPLADGAAIGAAAPGGSDGGAALFSATLEDSRAERIETARH